MKKTLFIASLFGTSVAFSQSLTQANEPAIGAAQTMNLCDPTTDPYAAITGSGVTWDYSTIVGLAGQERDVTIEDATTDPNFSNFPGATKTLKVQNALTTFMSSTLTERVSQGFVYTEPTFGEVIATFNTDNEKIVEYPFANGSSLTDYFEGSLSFEFNGVPQNPATTGNAYAWIDGQGTLIQADGTSLTDVIRYKLVDTSYASIMIFGNLEVIRNQYEYYDLANGSLPVFTYSRVVIQQMGGGTPLTDQVIVLSSALPTSYVNVDETAVVDFNVFPNPTTGDVTIKGNFEGNGTVEILDNSGRLLNSLPLSTGMTVNLSSYDTGMYMVKVTNNGLTTTKTVVKRQLLLTTNFYPVHWFWTGFFLNFSRSLTLRLLTFPTIWVIHYRTKTYMKHILLALLFLNSFHSLCQVNEDLTSEERAYLFHIVKKSPILNNNFGRYFDYQGPNIVFPNGEQNYDSIELLIINQPDLLIIRKDEIAKSSKGLIAEASNKMALWELNKVLLAKRDSPNDLKEYQNEYAVFEKLLLEKLPPSALKEKDGVSQPQPKLFNVLNPSLSFEDKIAMLESLRFLSTNDQLLTIQAMNYAVSRYTELRTLEIYRSLGGKTENFRNLLTSAGDGSSTTGMLEEREKDEKGRWNKGLPKAVGLFPYDVRIEQTEEKKKVTETIEPMRYTMNSFQTVGKNEYTNVHFDVWGYNSSSQTTVVLEKNGLSYQLFGSGETRFLSPDSSFSSGKTFQAIINDLEFNKIGNLNEMIYGKKGFDYWIEYNEKKRDQTELKIEKKEKEYSDLGYSPVTTSSKPSRAVKKSKKNAIKSGAGGFNGTPTTSSNRKTRKKLQNGIVSLYETYEAYKRKIAELEQQKQEAIDLMAIYQLKLDLYKELIGRRWAEYTEKDGLYLFQDSSTFDLLTQDFQFKPTKEQETFELRLIAIPLSALSDQADEVMLHATVMDAEPNYDARINIGLEDVFASDKWELPSRLFTKEDSVALRVFFEGLLDKQVDFSIIARGQGIGSWDGNRTIKDDHPIELQSYPGNSAVTKMDSTFVRLRKSELLIRMNRSIELEINSFTDPVASSLVEKNEALMAGMIKYGLSKNDLLSAHRTYSILVALKSEINELAGDYLTREDAKIVIDRFNREWEKTKISVGRTSFKLESFRY